MNDVREEIQQEAKVAYLSKPAPRANTLIVGTGGGKSKIAIDIIKELKPSSILLLTNSENLRDTNWKAEFEKFGAMDYWEKTTSECYQTVYKWKLTHYDLVIADEIDFAMSPMYRLYFRNNKWNNLLGLTGFCAESKQMELFANAPVCYEITTQEMQNEGLLNKSEVIIVEFHLSAAKTIKVPMKNGGHFFTSENEQYKYYNSEFQKAVIVKTKADQQANMFPSEENKKKAAAAEWKFKICAAKRMKVLRTLDSSVKVVKSILKAVEGENNKVLIYSALQSQADKFGLTTYYGDAEDSILGKLNSGEIKALAVCKKLNRGTNLVGVNYIIKESFDGSETDFQQQHGRAMRLKPDQTAKIIILMPYFSQMVSSTEKTVFGNRVKNSMITAATQASKWAEKMLASFAGIPIKTIKMNQDYSLPEGAELILK